jgi:hypothetical protein
MTDEMTPEQIAAAREYLRPELAVEPKVGERFRVGGSWLFGLRCRLRGSHDWAPGPTRSASSRAGWWALTGKDRGWRGATMYRRCRCCAVTEYQTEPDDA